MYTDPKDTIVESRDYMPTLDLIKLYAKELQERCNNLQAKFDQAQAEFNTATIELERSNELRRVLYSLLERSEETAQATPEPAGMRF